MEIYMTRCDNLEKYKIGNIPKLKRNGIIHNNCQLCEIHRLHRRTEYMDYNVFAGNKPLIITPLSGIQTLD